MDLKFDFEKVGQSYFGLVYRPVAKVSLKSPKSNISTTTWMIVDTGADFTILPQYLADDLGISLEEDCLKTQTSGVGGDRVIYLCKSKIQAKIGPHQRQIPIAFFDSNEIPALMGRLGFLETFNTQFLKNHTLVFKN